MLPVELLGRTRRCLTTRIINDFSCINAVNRQRIYPQQRLFVTTITTNRQNPSPPSATTDFYPTASNGSQASLTTGSQPSTSRPQPQQPLPTSSQNNPIQDAKFLFNQVWSKLEKDYGGRENLRFPNELVLLMGSPGAGKTSCLPAILRARGITANRPIVISQLLERPDAETKRLMDRGEMVGDSLVLQLLLEALLKCNNPDIGVLVDGFPRTEIQGEFLKLLHDKMSELRTEFFNTPLRDKFRRPIFRITALYVEEAESVRRQLQRGRKVEQHNKLVEMTGQGDSIPVRPTDYDESLIRSRYKVFLRHFDALMKLKKFFPFHLISAVGSIEDVMHAIWKEFEYQSSYELDQRTFDTIQHIPIASKVGVSARQDLVRRLESYSTKTLEETVQMIDRIFMPAIRRHAISGMATVRIEAESLTDPYLIDVIMDVLSERGYRVSVDPRVFSKPVRVNPETWEIQSEQTVRHIFNVQFPQHSLRGVYSAEPAKDLVSDVGFAGPLPTGNNK